MNTVLRAYNELGREGIITSEVGKGTFVNITRQELKSHNRQVLLKKIIEHSLEEALSLEFSMEEFQRVVTDYITGVLCLTASTPILGENDKIVGIVSFNIQFEDLVRAKDVI